MAQRADGILKDHWELQRMQAGLISFTSRPPLILPALTHSASTQVSLVI